MRPVLFPDDAQFWYETQRVLGHTAYGGADIGEVLTTAQRITSGDYESWHDEWLATAERVAEEARNALAAGHRCTARDGLLRASSYYRSAESFLHGAPGDPRISYSYERQIECFQVAGSLFDPPIEAVEVPYEGTVLLGYFYRSGSGPRPTIIIHSGFDGSMEELHFFGASAAVERGYNVVTFDGPGQPAAIHRSGLVLRPDWERVVTPVVDWVLGRRDVDAQRVSLMGLSMGGLLAARAAAFEHRLAACIAVDGLYDLGVISTSNLPGRREEAEVRLRSRDAPDIDAALEMAMATNSTMRWAITHGMYVTGTDTPRGFIASYLDYSLRGGIAERIVCPTLVCEAEEDLFFQGQPEDLYDHLTCPKSLMRFTDEEGAGTRCHSGAQRLAFGRIFDWLDETTSNV